MRLQSGVREGSAFAGNPLQYFFSRGVGTAPNTDYASTIPHQSFMLFQMMFFIITPALISGRGSGADQVQCLPPVHRAVGAGRVSALCHMIWGKAAISTGRSAGRPPCSILRAGTVVHISSGMAALVCCLVLESAMAFPANP